MTQERLNEVLRLHLSWLNDDEGGKCADLSGEDLSFANLFGVKLKGAKLIGATIPHIGIYTFNLGRDDGWYFEGNVQIGCEHHSLEHWLEHYESIGKNAGYSEDEIRRYGAFLSFLDALEKDKKLSI